MEQEPDGRDLGPFKAPEPGCSLKSENCQSGSDDSDVDRELRTSNTMKCLQNLSSEVLKLGRNQDGQDVC